MPNETIAAPIYHSPAKLEELIARFAVAGDDDHFVLRRSLLGDLLARDAPPPRPAPPPAPVFERKWIRPAEALQRVPFGGTLLHRLLANGTIRSKLVSGCRLIDVESLDAVGDPQGRLKRGRPRKVSTTPPSPPLQARRHGRPRRDADADAGD
jgi:hypothetical protein